MNNFALILTFGILYPLVSGMVFAQESVTQPPKLKAVEPVLDSNANITGKENTVLREIEVVSDEELRSYFIFIEEHTDSDQAINDLIEERDLAADPFLMQNIDREEFEQERILLVFKDLEDQNKRKSYGILKVTDNDFKPQILPQISIPQEDIK